MRLRDTARTMSQENVELVQSIYAHWERGDYSSAEWAHPEIQWEFAADGPAPREGTGLAGMAKDWGGYISAWEEFHHKADEYLDLDTERVLVLQRLIGRGKTSGLDLDQVPAPGAVLFHIRGGKVTRLVGYFHRERALADLGLSEQDAHADA
jgi:ketosteroid isomerase-like protein